MSKVTVNQQIVPFLWFDGNAEEAMNFYTSVFPDSEILLAKKWGDGTPFPANWIMAGAINLNGLKVHLFDAGPQFKFNEAVSFFVNCETQEEIDTYWTKLIAGGSEGQCGWLKDKFGLSWQVTPTRLIELISDKDAKKAQRAMDAMMKMRKIIIADIEKAAAG